MTLRMLLQREAEEARVSGSRKESWVSTTIVTLVVILLLWLVGPGGFSFLKADRLTELIVICSLFHTSSQLHFLLTQDSGHRQMAFLQCLPIRKQTILAARFTFVLRLWLKTFAWMALVVLMNLLLNDRLFSLSWTPLFLAAAISLLFLTAMLFRYYFWGYDRWGETIHTVSLFIWIILFLTLDFMTPVASLNGLIWALGILACSIAVNLICWRLAIWRIRKKGFPHEEENPELLEIEQRAQELKSEQMKK